MNFCPNLSNKKIKQEFEELVSIFGETGAYFLWNKSNGNGLELALNGADSQLFKLLLDYHKGDRVKALRDKAKIYNKRFTDKFGDWINDVGNTSVTLDENGEPTIVSVVSEDLMFNLYETNLSEEEQKLFDYYVDLLGESRIKNLEDYVRQVIKENSDQTTYFDRDKDALESKADRINDKYGAYVKAYVHSFTSKNGLYRLHKLLITLKKEDVKNIALFELNRYVKSYVKSLSNEDVKDLILNLEQEGFMFYINPKKVDELKRQVNKKSEFASEEEIDEAFEFLQELENEKENNAYVECCIRWLKNDAISLPRDNEKVRQAFDYARKNHLDLLQFKHPIEIIIKEMLSNRIKLGKPVADFSKYRHISFSHAYTRSDGVVIKVYNVEDNSEGQLDVANILHDTAPIKDGNSIDLSPWCLSTYNYDKSAKKVSLTSSAKRYWNTYNGGKRQIAFINGRPIAFNSSSRNTDEWWDFKDGSENGYKGWSSLDDLNLESSKSVYNEASTSWECINIGKMGFNYDGNRIRYVTGRGPGYSFTAHSSNTSFDIPGIGEFAYYDMEPASFWRRIHTDNLYFRNDVAANESNPLHKLYDLFKKENGEYIDLGIAAPVDTYNDDVQLTLAKVVVDAILMNLYSEAYDALFINQGSLNNSENLETETIVCHIKDQMFFFLILNITVMNSAVLNYISIIMHKKPY